jgi:hypothetical protein
MVPESNGLPRLKYEIPPWIEPSMPESNSWTTSVGFLRIGKAAIKTGMITPSLSARGRYPLLWSRWDFFRATL